MRRTDSLEKTLTLGKTEGKRKRGWQKMREHHQLNGHESEQTPGDREGQGSLACCSPWGCEESDMTEQLNNSKVRERLAEKKINYLGVKNYIA